MYLGEEICFRAAKYLVVRRDKDIQRIFEPSFDYSRSVAGANPATFSRAGYKGWRQRELARQFDQNFGKRKRA